MFDSTSVMAAELLSYFGRNTAVELDHKYGSTECAVVSTRTKNVIATVVIDSSLAYEYVDFATTGDVITASPYNLELVAARIMQMKKFPKNRKMNRAWSPIRLTAKAEADAEITRATVAWTE
jgi:hypothetical protein